MSVKSSSIVFVSKNPLLHCRIVFSSLICGSIVHSEIVASLEVIFATAVFNIRFSAFNIPI